MQPVAGRPSQNREREMETSPLSGLANDPFLEYDSVLAGGAQRSLW